MNPWALIGWLIVGCVALSVLRVIAYWLIKWDFRRHWERDSRKWRKNVQPGDKAYFESLSGLVEVEIAKVENGKVLTRWSSGGGSGSAWRAPEELMAFNQDIADARRSQAFASLRRMAR